MHRKAYETQKSLLFMCFNFTFDRNNKALIYLLNHLKFCNDCNKLNKQYKACDRHEKQLDWLCVTDGQTCI